MGASQSQEEAKTQIVENSTGTHLLELHMPSMGFGFGMLMMCLLILVFSFRCVRKYMDRRLYPRANPITTPAYYPHWNMGAQMPIILNPLQYSEMNISDHINERKEAKGKRENLFIP